MTADVAWQEYVDRMRATKPTHRKVQVAKASESDVINLTFLEPIGSRMNASHVSIRRDVATDLVVALVRILAKRS